MFTNEYASKKIGFAVFFLIILLQFFLPESTSASGIGFRNFNGSVSISNSEFRDNFIGIQFTTTNAASIANKTINNLRIDNNIIQDSSRHGIKIDLVNTGAITIENNTLDNSNVPSTAPDTKNGRFGIRIKNNSSPSIANNTIKNFGRSGIQLQNINLVTVVNNLLQSNGTQNYTAGNKSYGSGLQATNSNFSYVSENTIRWNLFSGIAADGTTGIIGPDNIIMYDGEEDSGSGSGNIDNCVPTIEDGLSVRGGILVQGLAPEEEMTIMCTNTITSNYYKDVAKNGNGTVSSCGNKINSFVLAPSHALYYYNANSGHVVHDCANSIINAATYPFGIIIEGSGSDVTVQNCSIMNAAMELQYTATIGNGTRIGAGIFIANNANPSIANNYIYSNGWALLDDRIYTEAGASGIQMRCADANTSIINNVIASNKNDGLTGRETAGMIGLVNAGNTFRNNGRGGIGLYNATNSNLRISYNAIHDNKRGIGTIQYDGDFLTISNNLIYSNLYSSQGNIKAFGGLTFNSFTGIALIENNTVRNNSGQSSGGGIWGTASNGTFSFINNVVMNNISSVVGGIGFNDLDGGLVYLEGNILANNLGQVGGFGITASNAAFSLINNQIMNNIGSTLDINLHNVGGVGFNLLDPSATVYLSGNTIENNRAIIAGGPERGRVGAMGFSASNATVSLVNNTVNNNDGLCIGGIGFDTFGGPAFLFSNIIYSNTNSNNDWGAGGLAFDAASGSITISNNTIYNNTNTGAGSGGVGINHLLEDASILFADNSIYNNNGARAGGIGFNIATSANVTITGNKIYNNMNQGLGFDLADGINALIDNNVIVSNNIEGNSRPGGIGFNLADNANITVSNNVVRHNAGGSDRGGMGFSEVNGTTLIVDDNTIASNTGNGMGIEYAYGSYVTIINNRFRNNNGYIGGLGLEELGDSNASDKSYLLIHNNIFTGNTATRYSAGCIGQDYGYSDMTITSNYFNNASGRKSGLSIWSYGSGPGHSMIFSANTVYGGNSGGGVRFRRPASGGGTVRVTGNLIYDTVSSDEYRGSGLSLDFDNQYLSAITIVDNTIYNNVSEYTDSQYHVAALMVGEVYSEANVTISNNLIYSSSHRGVSLNGYGGVNDTLIASNLIFNHPLAGIPTRSRDKLTMRNNEIWSNGSGNGAGQLQDSTLDTQSGAGTWSVKLNANSSNTPGYYDGKLLIMDSGINSGQARLLHNYNNESKIANVTPNWITQPNELDDYRIMRSGDAGVFLAGYNGALIENNTFRNNSGMGLGINAATGNYDIDNNIVVSNTRRGLGIDYAPSANFSITNNQVRYNSQMAIGFDYADGFTLFMDNNTVVSNRYEAIRVSDSAGSEITITNNTVRNNAPTGTEGPGGIGVRNADTSTILISDNIIFSNGCDALGVNNSDGCNVTITNNLILKNDNNAFGIGLGYIGTLDNKSTVLIHNNILSGNTFNNSNNACIGLRNGYADTTITSNYVNNSAGNEYAVGIDSYSGGVGHSLIFSANTIFAGDVRFKNPADNNGTVTITNNTIFSAYIGLSILGAGDTTTNTYIVSNTVYRNTEAGFRLRNGNNLIFNDNQVWSSGSGGGGGELQNSTLDTQSGMSNWKVRLNSSASGSGGYYDGMMLLMNSGVNSGQIRLLFEYDGEAKVAKISPRWQWPNYPNENDTYTIIEPVDVGVGIAAYTNADVQNNTIQNNTGAGMIFDIPSGAINIDDNLIISNAATDAPGGIGLNNGDNVTLSVTNNTVRNNTRNGTSWGISGMGGQALDSSIAYISNNVFSDNTHSSARSRGQMGFERGTIDLTVLNNRFIGELNYNSVGLDNNRIYSETYVEGGAWISINTLVFSGNTIDAVGVGRGLGTYCFKKLIVTGNTVHDFTRQGLGIDCGDCTEASTIENNTVYNSSGGDPGIAFDDPIPGSVARFNTVYNVQDIGLAVDYGSNFIIEQNVLYSNDQGLAVRRSDFASVRNNQVFRNNDAGIQGRRNDSIYIINNQIWSNGSGLSSFFDASTLGVQGEIGANQVVLGDSASPTSGYYNNMYLFLDSGAGSTSPVRIYDYDGESKLANITPSWQTAPSQGDDYHIIREASAGIRLKNEQWGPDESTTKIFSNDIRGNSGFGVSFADFNADEIITLSANTIVSNDFTGIALGVLASTAGNQGSFFIDNSVGKNYIRNNGFSASNSDNAGGIGITDFTGSLTIDNNDILYNTYAGIQAKNMTPTGLMVANNQIRSNSFAGIALNNAQGYFGPNNTVKNNGNGTGDGATTCGNYIVKGSGDGGVAVRSLASPEDTVIVSQNVIENNYIYTITRKDCGGTVRLDGQNVSCGNSYWEIEDAVMYVESDHDVYINGISVTNTTLIDCENNPLFSTTIYGGNVWGIAVIGATGMTIRNCTVKNNMLLTNSFGEDGTSSGGGILLGPGVDALVYNNVIHSNGAEVAGDNYGTNSGIAMSCSENQIWSNWIYGNASDGIDANLCDLITIGKQTAKNFIYNNGRNGIGINGTSIANIANNELYNNSKAGIGLNNATLANVTITNNEIHDNLNKGIGFDLSNGVTAFIDNNVIVSNNIEGDSRPGGIGFNRADNSYITVSNNEIRHNAGGSDRGGIGFDDVNGTTLIVDDNTIASNTGNGMGIDYAYGSYVTIINNRFRNNNGYAGGIGLEEVGDSNADDKSYVLISNNIFTGNTASSNRLGCIGQDYGYSDMTITGNYFNNATGRRSAISIWSYGSGPGHSLIFSNNTVYGGNSGGGVRFRRPASVGGTVRVTGNLIYDTTSSSNYNGSGLSLDFDNQDLSAITIADNTIFNNVSEYTDSRYNVAGLMMGEIHSEADVTISNNLIYSSSHRGIAMNGFNGVNDTVIVSNQIFNHPIVGIQTRSRDGLTMRYNEIWSNGSGSNGRLMQDSTLDTQSGMGTYQVRLNPSSSGTSGYYDGKLLIIDSGIDSGQARLLYNYDGESKIARVTPNWATKPNELDDYRIADPADAGVSATGYSSYDIQDNTIRNNNGRGLAFNAAGQDFNIVDNVVTSNTKWGIGIQNAENANVTVSGNEVRNNISGGVGFRYIDGVTLLMDDNTIVSHTNFAVGVQRGNGGNLNFTNNSFRNNYAGGYPEGNSGIQLSAVDNAVINIIGNTLFSGRGSGIGIYNAKNTNASMINNQFNNILLNFSSSYDTSAIAVHYMGSLGNGNKSTMLIHNNIFSGNKILGNVVGCIGQGNSYADTTITSNYINNLAGDEYGVSLKSYIGGDGGHSLTFDSNTIYGGGVKIKYPVDNTGSLEITNNTISSGITGLQVFGAGDTTTNTLIASNQIYINAEAGMRVRNGNNITLRYNQVWSSGSGGSGGVLESSILATQSGMSNWGEVKRIRSRQL